MPLHQPRAAKNDAAREIEQAYDGIHRVEVILAFLKRTMNQGQRGIGPIFDEAKHTYVQSISRYVARDFDSACELALASTDLSRAVEIVISKTVRTDAAYASLLPFSADSSNASQVDHARTEDLLSSIRWLTKYGALPPDELAQVLKIESWSEGLYDEAHRLPQTGEGENAIELWQAAFVLARAAEHVCKRWCVAQGGNQCLTFLG